MDFRLNFFNLFDIVLMLLKRDTKTTTSTLREATHQDIIHILKFQVLFHQNVEEISKCEITKRHQVANWFHDIPTGENEGTVPNKRELTKHYA